MNWFIKVRDMVYGPYSKERMARFAAEGRVSFQTMVSDNQEHGFKPAADDAELRQILTELNSQQSQNKTIAPSTNTQTTQALVLYTKLSKASEKSFVQSLKQFGNPIQPVAGVWILHSSASSDKLRNLLSRDMGASDSLLIFKVSQTQAAWFNIGETADRQIREYLSSGG
ncbi:hypothetical protein MNBD_ALPHA06-643 [hydrothermal vent metagenome]|uniref:GYF domain-containing protein n=1 Tax=hydrothermal vent metagenome TaxID=652676 RepID=A0A3B0RFM3_9ZZZZ